MQSCEISYSLLLKSRTVDYSVRPNGRAEGGAMSSDAFFPFRDAVDEAAKAGIKAIIQAGGSKNDEEVIKSADEHGMAMVFSGVRLFRH